MFIDEPELSLHPEWQAKYIQFLKDVLGDDVQIIIATHSPYIARSALESGDVDIVRLQVSGGNLTDERLHRTTSLPSTTFAEVNYKAFGILSEELHIELYLALQRVYAPEHWDTTSGSRAKWSGGRPSDLDKVLSENHGVELSMQWTEANTERAKSETLMTFIRNIIHHGDEAIQRGRNRTYTQDELLSSIEQMSQLL